MRKQWCCIGMIGLMLSACTTNEQASAPTAPAQTYNGPVVEISGAEPRYEPVNPANSQDYQVNGKTYRINQHPQNYSETGLASWYDSESNGTRTANGETFDAYALAAAHPTLPLPSYVRVTNISNGRQLVVRVNDRGPYKPGRIIDLTRAAGDRLNISNNSRVKVDYIQVAPDGTLSGPGTIGTVVAKQSYALPDRPDLGGAAPAMSGESGTAAPVMTGTDNLSPAASATDIAQPEARPVMDSAPQSSRGGFLGAPQPLPPGVIESPQPAPATAVAAVAAPAAAASAVASGGYLVQVGAVGDHQRAISLQQSLSQRFGVPGKITPNGNLYRIQLGPFSSRQQANALSQRLASEAQQPSFITTDSL